MYNGDGLLLTSTKDVVDRWREYFESLLNPTSTPSGKEARPGVPEMGSGIFGVEVAEVVKKLFGGRTPGADEIRLELFKALDDVGLSWLTRLCNVGWTSGAVPLMSIYRPIFVPTLTYGQQLWVVTKRPRSRVQAPEMRSSVGWLGS